ncbi:MAG: thioredoxin family protein [Bacteroidales bacterium]|nr:thioredoxin family protein [Bacteroidales bacterium]
MKKILLLLALAASLATGVSAQAVKVYDEKADAMKQINEAVALAQRTDRYVMCQVGGNWCPWCLRFAEFATTDSVVAPLMEKNYVYIHVNYSKGNKNLEAMRFLGNPGRFGYPVFVVLNQKGEPIHIQESESLEEGKGYSRKRVEKFLRLWNKESVEAEAK